MEFTIQSVDEAAIWVRVQPEVGDVLPPHLLAIRLGVGDDGRLVATGVHLDAGPHEEVTARDLRFPLAKILSEFTRFASDPDRFKRLLGQTLPGVDVTLLPTGEGPQTVPGGWRLIFEQWLRWHAGGSTPAVMRARPGRAGYPDEHYEHVAELYRQAKRQRPRAPIRALMGELHVSEPTVHRWLRTAAEKGFLKEEER